MAITLNVTVANQVANSYVVPLGIDVSFGKDLYNYSTEGTEAMLTNFLRDAETIQIFLKPVYEDLKGVQGAQIVLDTDGVEIYKTNVVTQVLYRVSKAPDQEFLREELTIVTAE